MSGDRRCFLQHLVICLAVLAGVFYAAVKGAPQQVWRTDLSYMTSLVAGLVILAAVYLGWQAWSVSERTSSAFGLFAMGLCPLLGLLGTSTGLRLNVTSLAVGGSGLLPLSTSIETMQIGVLGLIIIAVMTFNLEAGIRSAQEHVHG